MKIEIVRVRIGKWVLRWSDSRCSLLCYYVGNNCWGRIEDAVLYSRHSEAEAQRIAAVNYFGN